MILGEPKSVIFGFSVSIKILELRFDSFTLKGRLESKYTVISNVGFKLVGCFV